MKQFFAVDGKYFQIMGRAFDIIVLNVLLIICSLPIITIGAAVTAVYDMSLRLLRGEGDSVVKGFFKAFKSNFVQATKMWLLCLVIIVVSVGDVLCGRMLAGFGLQLPLSIVAGIQLFILLLIMQYAFPLIARFENTMGGTLKNSILLTMTHMPVTILMAFVNVSAILILAFFPLPAKIFNCFITILLMLWFAGGIYFNCKRLHHIFQKQFGSEEFDLEDY